MTDTDEIRAAWGSYDHHVPTPWEKVAELCDAVDAARAQILREIAERDAAVLRYENAVRIGPVIRAGQAQLIARAEAAEARIRAVRDYMAQHMGSSIHAHNLEKILSD